MVAPYPQADERFANPAAETDMSAVKAAIHAGRSLRSSYGIVPSVRAFVVSLFSCWRVARVFWREAACCAQGPGCKPCTAVAVAGARTEIGSENPLQVFLGPVGFAGIAVFVSCYVCVRVFCLCRVVYKPSSSIDLHLESTRREALPACHMVRRGCVICSSCPCGGRLFSVLVPASVRVCAFPLFSSSGGIVVCFFVLCVLREPASRVPTHIYFSVSSVFLELASHVPTTFFFFCDVALCPGASCPPGEGGVLRQVLVGGAA